MRKSLVGLRASVRTLAISFALLASGFAAQQLYSQDRAGAPQLGGQSSVGKTYAEWAVPFTPQDNLGPLAVCFSADNPPSPDFIEDMMAALAAEGKVLDPTSDYFLTTKWGSGQGNGFTLRWSFVPDGLSIPNGIGEGTAPSNLFSTMNSKFASQGGQATWILRFEQCFARWSALTGITYQRVTAAGVPWDDGASWGSAGSSTRGDVRICMKPLDGNSGVLAYNNFPTNGDMVLDSGESWQSTSSLNRFLRNVIMHEHGHGIGLLHSCSNNSGILMEPLISTSFDGPQHDDIRAGKRHYGDPTEPDNNTNDSVDLGLLIEDTTITDVCALPTNTSGSNPANTSNCSIDGNGDEDWFKLAIADAGTLAVTLTPAGLTYQNAGQAGNGSCPTTGTTNSLIVTDLAVDIRASNGTTVIASASSAAAGLNETIAATPVAAGIYYIRVYETSSPNASQLYSLAITANLDEVVVPPCPEDVTGDGVVNDSDLGQLLAVFGCDNAPGCELGDIDGDNIVNDSDLGVLLSAFGSVCP